MNAVPADGDCLRWAGLPVIRMMKARHCSHWHPLFGEEAREPMARVRQRLVERYWEERTFRMADTS